MCRLYALRASEPTKVECSLVHAQNALMAQSREDLAGHSHAHGWGVAAYEDHAPHVERQAWAAYHGEHFRRAAARVYATTVLAHVRDATVGEPTLANTHPFTHERWSFAHNGTLPAFDAVRPLLLERISDKHRAQIGGITDSEHIFRLLMTKIDARPSAPLADVLRDTAREVIALCNEITPEKRIGLNLMATDGAQLAGTRFGRTLFYVERRGLLDCEICGFPHVHHHPGADYRALIIASEPITHENWSELPDDTAYAVNARFELERSPLSLSRRD
ncbi:MAG: class II glutamine amidotransferase [Maricaulaceae bacterium]